MAKSLHMYKASTNLKICARTADATVTLSRTVAISSYVLFFSTTYCVWEIVVQVWQGAIAGSAPIWTYIGQSPPMDPGFYAKGVTYDTTVAAGSAPGCTNTLRRAWAQIILQAESGRKGLDSVSKSMRICPNVKMNSTEDAFTLREWAGDAFDMMAMGNYPFPSSYMLNGHGELPAFPVRVACSALMDITTEVRAACCCKVVNCSVALLLACPPKECCDPGQCSAG